MPNVLAKDLDTIRKQATTNTKHPPQHKPKNIAPRQLGEIKVKRRYLPPHAQPFSSMNPYPLSKPPFSMITSVEVQVCHDAQLLHACEPNSVWCKSEISSPCSYQQSAGSSSATLPIQPVCIVRSCTSAVMWPKPWESHVPKA